MRAVYHDEFGSPPRVLKLGERPMPEPGLGQVRVKLLLSPIHMHDLMTVAGHYGILPELPAVPGTEALGIVDALGEGVANLKVGQRVAGGSHTWAEYYLVDAARALPLPDSIDDATASQLISMPLSARMFVHKAEVEPGGWIIQNAANGLVGRMVAGFAADQGINVVGLVRRDEGVAELAALGIGNVVSTEHEGWQEQVKALTGGKPILKGLESIGGRAADDMLGVMGRGATIYSFGALSGRPLQISPDNLLFKQARVEGFWMALIGPATPPELMGKLIGEIVAKAAAGKLKLEVAERFDIADVAKAAEAATAPGRPGKVVLTA